MHDIGFEMEVLDGTSAKNPQLRLINLSAWLYQLCHSVIHITSLYNEYSGCNNVTAIQAFRRESIHIGA